MVLKLPQVMDLVEVGNLETALAVGWQEDSNGVAAMVKMAIATAGCAISLS